MGRRKSKFKYRPKKGKEVSPTVASSSAAPPPPPPWIELPADVTANILKRLGAVEIMESAQKVCTTWRKVCHDPSMWRVIKLDNPHPGSQGEYELMCRQAVDRSQGELIDLTLTYFGNDDLINYVADRSSQLKRLTLQDCIDISGEGLIEAVKKLPHLEELHLIIMTESVSSDEIINIGISCPMLKSFSFNDRGSKKPNPEQYMVEDEFTENSNEVAQAIAKSMPNLCHLRLFADWMKNDGLEAILDGCPKLESLDIRQCFRLDLKQGALGKRCSQQIKHVKYPFDSTSDINWMFDDDSFDGLYDPRFSDYDSLDDYGYFDDLEYYDDFTNPFNDMGFFGDDEPWIFGHDYDYL